MALGHKVLITHRSRVKNRRTKCNIASSFRAAKLIKLIDQRISLQNAFLIRFLIMKHTSHLRKVPLCDFCILRESCLQVEIKDKSCVPIKLIRHIFPSITADVSQRRSDAEAVHPQSAYGTPRKSPVSTRG